jgi:hypothetical protein
MWPARGAMDVTHVTRQRGTGVLTSQGTCFSPSDLSRHPWPYGLERTVVCTGRRAWGLSESLFEIFDTNDMHALERNSSLYGQAPKRSTGSLLLRSHTQSFRLLISYLYCLRLLLRCPHTKMLCCGLAPPAPRPARQRKPEPQRDTPAVPAAAL